MDVHVVAPGDNWILDRYARCLGRLLGWTVGRQPRAGAEVNHFMPYLLLRDRPAQGKVSAWFTHLEERGPTTPGSKIGRWHRAARLVDLRCCQAQKYADMLSGNGPTVVIPTPVDAKAFHPRRLRVGVAGRVYKHPSRKGEHLVRKLLELEEFEVVGAGKGWPCPTTFYSRDALPDFFRSLDVFLITSEVEGGPDTLLEALACGLPVVAPLGVGFCDELPVDFRYPRGDFEAMVASLREINAVRYRRRQAVLARTEEALAYERAFAEFLHD